MLGVPGGKPRDKQHIENLELEEDQCRSRSVLLVQCPRSRSCYWSARRPTANETACQNAVNTSYVCKLPSVWQVVLPKGDCCLPSPSLAGCGDTRPINVSSSNDTGACFVRQRQLMSTPLSIHPENSSRGLIDAWVRWVRLVALHMLSNKQ